MYDGFDESSNELLAQCGTNLPRPSIIMSTSNVVYIKLDVSAFEIHVS